MLLVCLQPLVKDIGTEYRAVDSLFTLAGIDSE